MLLIYWPFFPYFKSNILPLSSSQTLFVNSLNSLRVADLTVGSMMIEFNDMKIQHLVWKEEFLFFVFGLQAAHYDLETAA